MPDARPLEPVSLFYSYSHADETLRDKLEKHLATLRRLGLISNWHDRRINPGKEWVRQLDENLLKADIILLLVSPDFINSDYCYSVEAETALDRHRKGTATVIPVLLRPVDIKGLPIGELQMLPKDLRAVTSAGWSSEDEAFRSVAEGIRTAVHEIVERRSIATKSIGKSSASEPRSLDAAVAPEIPVGETREVLVMVPVASSLGLRGILSDRQINDSCYTCKSDDVQSQAFRARYVETADGKFLSPEFRLSLYGPGFALEDNGKKFTLEPSQDSLVFTFLVRAENPGDHRIRVDLHSKEWSTAEVMLKTTAVQPPGLLGGLVASLELFVRVLAKAASA